MKRDILWSLLFVAACGGSSHDNGGDDGANVDAGNPPVDSPVLHSGVASFPLKSVRGGIAYTASVKIGTQTFDLDTDTGSTTLGVAATACATCTSVTTKYTPGATAADQHTKSSSTYADNTGWKAENFSDDVSFDGETATVNMRFGAIQSQTMFFQGFDDGIIGFASDGLALGGTDSIVSKREAAGENGQFAFQMCADTGNLWMGGYDPAATTAPPQVSPMVPMSAIQPFYEVNIQSAKLGDTAVAITGSGVADTGTSILVLADAQEKALTAAIQNSAGFKATFPGVALVKVVQQQRQPQCFDPGALTNAQIDAALPPFTITLPEAGGGTFDLTMPATQSYLLLQSDGQQTAMCYAVQSINQPGIPIIIGDTILRSWVTVFDVAAKTIAFAPQKGCAVPPAARSLQRPPFDPAFRPNWRIRGEWH